MAALATLMSFVTDDHIDEDVAVRIVRGMGRTAARLAEWQVSTLAEAITGYDAVDRRLDTALSLTESSLAQWDALLAHAWHRHLSAALQRMVAAGHPPGQQVRTTVLSVGFADLVSFTRLTRRLSVAELGALVDSFEVRTVDLVATHGARVVKTLGDEIMFVADTPRTAVEVALGLIDALAEDPEMPRVRAGVATGTVVARLGDVYGTPVNLASRLTALAPPQGLLVDDATAAALRDAAAFTLRAQGTAEVSGLGEVGSSLVTRAGTST